MNTQSKVINLWSCKLHSQTSDYLTSQNILKIPQSRTIYLVYDTGITAEKKLIEVMPICTVSYACNFHILNIVKLSVCINAVYCNFLDSV